MSETIAAAEVKKLTRNPLIPWKRLVEMNLNSMSFSNGVDTVTEKSHGNTFNVSSDTVKEKGLGNGFNGSLGSVPEYLCHKIPESGSTLDISGCCYKYLVTENANDHLDRDSYMECSFGKEQNEMKIHSKESHDKSICSNEGMYTEENRDEVRPDGGHHTFVTNEVDFKFLPEFKDGVNNLKGSDAQTIYNMAVREGDLNFEQELDSTGQTPYCYKNILSLLDVHRKISNLNCLEVSVGEYDKNAATGDTIPDVSLVCDTKQTTGNECNTADVTLSRGIIHALQDEENTFDAHSEKNCSKFDDSGIITHTDGVPCSLNENTLRETDIDGDSDWDLSFDDETFLELCPDDNDGAAVLATEKTDQPPNVFCSEGLRNIPLDSNMAEIETNLAELETIKNETLNIAVDNEIFAGHCLVEDRHLNRSARQTGHYSADKKDSVQPGQLQNHQSSVQEICEPYRRCCNDIEDYEHPSPQLNCQSRVHETCQPYAHSDTSDDMKGGLTSPSLDRNKENYHGLKESDNLICSDDASETVRTIRFVEHHRPDFVNGTEIKHRYDSELENTSQDVAVRLRGTPDLRTCINNEMMNADGALEFSCDDVGGDKYNHENVETFLTKNVCVVDTGAFECYPKNPDVLSSTECFGSDNISTVKKCLTSTKSITTDEREIRVCCLGDIGSKWGREESRDENFVGDMENADVDKSLLNIVDHGNTDENLACNLGYGNFEVGDRSICDELDTSPHDSHSQMNSTQSPHESHSQMKSATSSHESHSQMNSATSSHESHSQMNSATSSHESHSQMNSATSSHESHSQMNSATSPHESHYERDMNSATSPHELHAKFGWQFDKLKAHELNLLNANLKRLTRDPLTCWQRLVDINIESMLSAKQQCAEGAMHSNGEEAKQMVKYPKAVNKPESNFQTVSASHLENVCSCDKYKLLEDMDVNYYDIDSSIFNVSCGGLTSSESKIERGVIREGEGLKITLEHEMSHNSKTEVTDDNVKEYCSSNSDTESEIRPNVSQDNLSQSRIDLSFAHSRGRVNIFSDQEESEKEFHEPNPFDRELDFPPPDPYSSDTSSEIASSALDTHATKVYDSSTSLQANGHLSHELSESMTKTEQVNDDLGLGANQLSLVGKINSSLTGVKRNIRKHVQSRQEKLGDWNSENKITVARWLNMLGKWGKKECNILLSTASQTPEHSVRLVLGKEVNEKLSTECRNKSPTFDSFHSVPDTQLKAKTGNIKLCDQGSQGYRPFDTTDVLLELHPHAVVSQHQEVVSQHKEVVSQHQEVVSQHQILGFEVNIDEPIQCKSLGDDYNSIEFKQSWELCKMEDSYSLKDTCVKHGTPSSLKDACVKQGAPSSLKDARVKHGAPSSLKDACVNHGVPSSGWAWFTNVVTKMVSSIKSSEPTRDEDMESTASNMTDKEGLQGEANNFEVFPRNYHCDQKYQSDMYKPIVEDYPQQVSFVETNEIYGRELASGENSDISFAEYISRHAIDNEWIREHLNSTKTRTCRSAITNPDDDMATTVQMVVDPRRSVRNPKLKTAYAFIRGRTPASNASADAEDRSSVISAPSQSEQSFDENIYTFEGPANASLKLKNDRTGSVLKQKINRKKNNHAFYREKMSPSKEVQNPKRASDRGKSEQRPPRSVKPIQKTHEEMFKPPRNIRRKTRLDKRDASAKITRQGSNQVGSSGRHGDASSGETCGGEYSGEIRFEDKADSGSDGRVIDIKSVFNDDVLSEYFRNQEYNIKPMVTTKATPRIPLYALTLPSAPQHRTSQDSMSARDLVGSPVSGMTRAVSVDVMSVDTMESGDAVLGDDLFQSSLECLLEMLLQRGKVNHAFVASIEGKILAKTSGLMIPADDVTTLICSLTSNYSGSVKLSLMTFTYTCFKDDLNSALIGKAENSIFVARLGSQNVVVGFTDPCTPGSCIREIQELSTALSQRGL